MVYIIVIFLALGIGHALLTKSSIDARDCGEPVLGADERNRQASAKQRDERADVVEVDETNKEGGDEL